MPISTIANNIHKYVFLELLPVVDCQLNYLVNKFRLISIHVDDGGLYGLGHVGAIQSRSCLSRSCCKTYLVVGHNMNYSIYVVIVEICHLQTFIDNPLPCHCSITMDKDS